MTLCQNHAQLLSKVPQNFGQSHCGLLLESGWEKNGSVNKYHSYCFEKETVVVTIGQTLLFNFSIC
jgi:hypothetical protein